MFICQPACSTFCSWARMYKKNFLLYWNHLPVCFGTHGAVEFSARDVFHVLSPFMYSSCKQMVGSSDWSAWTCSSKWCLVLVLSSILGQQFQPFHITEYQCIDSYTYINECNLEMSTFSIVMGQHLLTIELRLDSEDCSYY